GKNAAEPGAKLDEGKVWGSLLRGFGNALYTITGAPIRGYRSLSFIIFNDNLDPAKIAWTALKHLQIFLDEGKQVKKNFLQDNDLALLEVANILTKGAQKYSPHGWKEVPHGVFRYYNAMIRHFLKESSEERDAEGFLHIGCVAWNALAVLELMLTKHEGKTLAEVLEEETLAVWNLNKEILDFSGIEKFILKRPSTMLFTDATTTDADGSYPLYKFDETGGVTKLEGEKKDSELNRCFGDGLVPPAGHPAHAPLKPDEHAVKVSGIKVYDPRDHQYKVSDNPALVMADMARRKHIHTGWDTDSLEFWYRIAKVADFCDEEVGACDA
ncbi:MAG: DUF5664 domain-containing protein, partial [Anaerolineales bacterium]|nr:DUF5664 domain-containing protein [Anaerolineales bacterium]